MDTQEGDAADLELRDGFTTDIAKRKVSTSKRTESEDTHKSDKKSESGSVTNVPQKNPSSLRSVMMMKRKISTWKNIAKNTPSAALSLSSREKQTLKPPAENTYRIEGDSDKKFNCKKVRTAIDESIRFFLSNQPGYNPDKCTQIARLMVDDLKNKIKDQGFERYKVVAQVVLGEVKDQGIMVCSRAVWDTKTDDSVSVNYRIKDMFAIVNVFGTYFE